MLIEFFSFEQTGYPCSVHQQGQTTDQTSIYGPSVLNQHYQYCSADTDPYGFPSCFNTPSPEPIQSYTELSTLKDHLSKMVNLLLELSLQGWLLAVNLFYSSIIL